MPSINTFLVCCAVLLCLALCSGCGYFRNLNHEDRLAQGYTIVLPGIEGASVFNSNIAQGLVAGGVPTAIEVDDWTTGCSPLFLYHLQAHARNRGHAQRLADKIVAYQDQYPGRPVNLIGHSGGGAMALMTLEALPPGRSAHCVVLIAPAISPGYDLRTALSRVEAGVWNFHSPYDGLFLVAGTAVFGTIDRRHTSSAGAFGFKLPAELSPAEAQLYEARLRQVPFDKTMMRRGNLGGHFGATAIPFVRHHIAPLLLLPTDSQSDAQEETH
jgi:pimeloyl-ACP methyl ester carboxylesterase